MYKFIPFVNTYWNNGSHGHTKGGKRTRIYRIRSGIQGRCNRINDSNYNRYGLCGIKCDRSSFEEFLDDMGESYSNHVDKFGEKDTSIDRIDNDGNYCKENCRWATLKEQANNKKNNITIIIGNNRNFSKQIFNVFVRPPQYKIRKFNKRLKEYKKETSKEYKKETPLKISLLIELLNGLKTDELSYILNISEGKILSMINVGWNKSDIISIYIKKSISKDDILAKHRSFTRS